MLGPRRQVAGSSGRRTCRGAIGALAFLVALLVCTSGARADWSALGDTVNPGPPFVGAGAAAADAGGTPYVAWWEATAEGQRIVVGRWTGSVWQVVGQPFDDAPVFDLPSITSVGGVPYVAFIENSADDDFRGQVRVWRLNATGDGWVAVDGGSLNHDPANGDAKDLSIATVGSVAHVAFTEVAGSATILRVKKLQGSSWVTVGAPLNVSPITALHPHIADVGGAPCVAWLSADSVGGMPELNGLRVSRFSGASWVVLGGKVRDGLSSVGHLTDVGGAPAVLFIRDESSYVVERWDGTSWSDLGDPFNDEDDPLLEGSFHSGSIATIGGLPYVALSSIPTSGSLRIRVLRYDGTAWTQVGSGLNRSAGVFPSFPVIASLGGDALVVWHEDDGDVAAIHAALFDTAEPPDTIITGTSTATNAGAATYGFTAVPAAGATFECSYDGAAFAPCISPNTSGVLSPGAHNFRVRATNAIGTDPTPARRDFIVDRVAPTTTIRLDGSRVPSGAYAGSVTVDADVTDPPLSSGPRSKFCVVDPPTPPTSFGAFGSQPCGVAVTAIGNHTAYAIANDEAGNASTIVSATFTIVAAPDTTITDGPSGVVYSVPSFRFASNVAGARFECRIDSGPYTACSSAILAYKVFDLSQGTHTFEVRAIDRDGLVDPSPASRTFTIGTQTLDGGCSFRFPFGGADQHCVAKRGVCPLGSVCTRVGEVTVVNEDVGISYTGLVSQPTDEFVPPISPGRYYPVSSSNGCSAPSIYPYTRGPCPLSWSGEPSNTVIGKSQSIGVACATYSDYYFVNRHNVWGGANPLAGPDEARGLICDATITIRPATALEATGTGTGPGTGVSIVVPGPGVLTIAPLAIRARSAAAGSAAPKPPFRSITRKIKSEGVKDLKLGLGPAEARTLRTERRLELTLEITFTPTGGESVSRTQTVVLTKQCRPTKKRPFC